MTKAVWTAAAAAVFLMVASAPVRAQATDSATVNVSVVVAAKAKLTITGGPVSFADADPTTTPVLAATSDLAIDVKARTSAAGNVTLTVVSSNDLKSGSDTITIDNLTWTVGGSSGLLAGTMNKTTAKSVGSWTGSGSFSGTQGYKLANSWAYNTGTYTTTLTYTLTAP